MFKLIATARASDADAKAAADIATGYSSLAAVAGVAVAQGMQAARINLDLDDSELLVGTTTTTTTAATTPTFSTTTAAAANSSGSGGIGGGDVTGGGCVIGDPSGGGLFFPDGCCQERRLYLTLSAAVKSCEAWVGQAKACLQQKQQQQLW